MKKKKPCCRSKHSCLPLCGSDVMGCAAARVYVPPATTVACVIVICISCVLWFLSHNVPTRHSFLLTRCRQETQQQLVYPACLPTCLAVCLWVMHDTPALYFVAIHSSCVNPGWQLRGKSPPACHPYLAHAWDMLFTMKKRDLLPPFWTPSINCACIIASCSERAG